jgi:cyclic pyranopterin phosphate synthase
MLRYEEIALVVEAAAAMDIRKIRLTGGEPLVRLGLPSLVGMLARIPGIDDLSMTTNGTLLAQHAQSLADAGLHRVNISLDSLQPERFRQITRRGTLDDVWAGVAAAGAAGLTPIKLNVVVVRGLNDDEVTEFARKTVTDGWHVRFIELMPIGATVHAAAQGHVPIAEIGARIEAKWGPLEAVRGPGGNGPARYYQVPGAKGSIGFIGALSDHICQGCNRLRLTADGKLRPCLMSDYEIDLRPALRAGGHTAALQERIRLAIQRKPAHHHLATGQAPQDRTMAQIGG